MVHHDERRSTGVLPVALRLAAPLLMAAFTLAAPRLEPRAVQLCFANILVDNRAPSGRSSKGFYDEGKQAAGRQTQADFYFNDTLNQDRTHFNNYGAAQHFHLIMDCLLNSTHASLAPLQNGVVKRGMKLQVDLAAPQANQFQVSNDLRNWRNYGPAQTMMVPVVKRYFHDVREGTMFYRAVTN